MPSTCFDYCVWINHENMETYDLDNESLMYLPKIYDNDSIGLANGIQCDLIPFDKFLEIGNDTYNGGKSTQLITSESTNLKNRKLEVSTLIEENGTATLIFDISLETEKDSGEYKYHHQHRYSSQDFTCACVDILVLLGQTYAK